MGQIVFLYFLQKKGWLGVGRDEKGNYRLWGEGPKNFLRRLFDKEYTDYKNFFNDVLEPLFYEALATERRHDSYSRFNCKIPFLNGGLFEPINDYDWDETDILIDNAIFSEILDIFDRYNFTVKEDDPLDKEVAVDPEMLGKVFENLLPENLRKGKGAYYTPRPIVHYMCQESLINYLATECEGTVPKADIETFIRKGESAIEFELAKEEGTKSYKHQIPNSIRKNAKLIDEKLTKIKICDPAIGSGAFPVGMLNEIVKARLVLDIYLKTNQTVYDIKRHCIQHSLYGVDIDSGAIDIAKLRLWLSLVVDEEDYHSIKPLPNLDFKIMQGNSLMEEFHGISLDLDYNKGEDYTLFGSDKKLDLLIKDLHQKQSLFFNATHHGDKEEAKQYVEEALLAVFRYELEKQKVDYFRGLKRIEDIAKTLKSKIRDQYLKEEKIKLSKQFNDFDFDMIEDELREMTHGNQVRNFFPWKLYFADVFLKKGGFDVVIANPPYGVKFTKEEKKIYNKLFKHQNYQLDSYLLFLEKAVELVVTSGNVNYIIPNPWLTNLKLINIRKLITNHTKILSITHYMRKVFDATVDTEVVILEKSTPEDHVVQIRIFEDKNQIIENFKKQKKWQKLDGEPINIFLDARSEDILSRIRTDTDMMKELCKIVVGMKPYQKGKGRPKQTKKIVENRIFDSNYQKDGQYKPLLRGKDIDKYIIKWGGDRWIKYGDWLAEPRPSANFNADEKIVIRQTGDSLIATLDTKKFICMNNMHIIHVINKKYSNRYILALLNSKLMNYYYQSLNPEKGEALAEVKKENVEKLVIKNATTNEQASFIEIVEKILSDKRTDPSIDTSKLESKIDHMVYKLYGLTEEEIAIVEESVGQIEKYP
jgi:hypothetical protein